ncbi:MAG TPA: cupin domain-containing protein [Stellaceae bacterium]|nr:cupin domain-containing protein [Stellaceae bacterium]
MFRKVTDQTGTLRSQDWFDNPDKIRAELDTSRRALVLAPLLGAMSAALLSNVAYGEPINPSETSVTLPSAIDWGSWIKGFPPHSGEVATLYGGLDKTGPYVVFMKWYPGFMSAPHTYATDRLSVVLSGTWWVNSGADFDPANAVPVPAGGFVRRAARTPHYDGVLASAKEPAVIALFGLGPVDLKLVDPSKPGWRRI